MARSSFERSAALVAVAAAQVILAAALRAVGREFAAGHGHERAVGPLDDLQIADDEAVVERDRAERLQPLAGVFHELDANLGDFHGRTP